MQRLTSDEQLEQIWEAAIDGGFAPIRTVDQWGEEFTIFDGWAQVEKVNDLVRELLPPDFLSDNAPIADDRMLYPEHHIEWAIGEFGFDDQYQTCSDCYCAVNTDGMNPNYFFFAELGELLCGDCIRKDTGLQDDYLTYLAQHFEDERSGVIKQLADPDKHGFIYLNFRSACCIRDEVAGESDHPEYRQWLTYGDSDEIGLLQKAAKLIDPNLQIVWAYAGGSNVLWARFNPNENIEFPFADGDRKWDYEYAEKCPVGAVDHVLGYVLGLVFNKYVSLHNKKGSKV